MSDYEDKRDFRSTPEPQDEEEPAVDPPYFVVQRHDATNEHYDFRLSIDDSLVSWAVPKGPSGDTADKRLAIRTEDHPLAYGDFEGTIPKDEYGGGTVMIWDRGSYSNPKDRSMAEQLEDGHIEVELEGERMKGGWAITHFRDEGDDEQWLLVKMDDDEAGADLDDDTSVVSGRTLEEIAEEES